MKRSSMTFTSCSASRSVHGSAGRGPASFTHVNDLRTDLRHDVDRGDAAKVRAKRRKAGATFALYAGGGTPDTTEPVKFPLVQSNILGEIEGDLRGLLLKTP